MASALTVGDEANVAVQVCTVLRQGGEVDLATLIDDGDSAVEPAQLAPVANLAGVERTQLLKLECAHGVAAVDDDAHTVERDGVREQVALIRFERSRDQADIGQAGARVGHARHEPPVCTSTPTPAFSVSKRLPISNASGATVLEPVRLRA